MAGRPMGKLHQDDVRFYVYDILDQSGSVIYVGKGSGYRARVSLTVRGGSSFEIVQRFKREADAYKFEIARIAEINPPMNKAKGGNGAKATKKRNVKDAWTKTFEAIGSQRYAALLLLNVFKASPSLVPDLSKVEKFREVAYG